MKYNLYSYTNYYGFKLYAIAEVNAMQRNYNEIIETSEDINELNSLCDKLNQFSEAISYFNSYIK